MAGVRVLYVENCSVTRERIQQLLESWGANVVAFDTLDAAKVAHAAGGFDVTITSGTLQDTEDGWIWASDLRAAGAKVAVMSTGGRPWMYEEVPHINEDDHFRAVRRHLAEFLGIEQPTPTQ